MSNYTEPGTDYKNVSFEFSRVNLLWNCCAIVKKLLELEARVDALEHGESTEPAGQK